MITEKIQKLRRKKALMNTMIRLSKLLNLYMDFLRECGYKESYLWTTHELDAAIHLYQRIGFTFTEEKESTTFGKALREQRYDLILL